MDAALASHQPIARAGDPEPAPAHDRLAELVIHLSGCNPSLAVAAVGRAVGDRQLSTDDERLGAVARALVTIRHGIDLTDKLTLP